MLAAPLLPPPPHCAATYLLQLLLPYTAGDLLDDLHKTGRVHSSEYTEAGTRLTASVPPQMVGVLQRYAVQSISSTAVQSSASSSQQDAAAAGSNGADSSQEEAASSSYVTGDWDEPWDGDYDDAMENSYEDSALAAEARAAVAAAAAGGGTRSNGAGAQQQDEGSSRRRRRGKGQKGVGGGSWLEQHQLPAEWGEVVQAAAAAPQAAVR